MQETARVKVIESAISELNGQVAVVFAQNVLKGGPSGHCFGFNGDIGPDYIFNTSIVDRATGCGKNGTIKLASKTSGNHMWDLIWTDSASPSDTPGFYSLTVKH